MLLGFKKNVINCSNVFPYISSRNKSFLIIILSKTDLRRFAITDDINLYITFSSEIGRQFLAHLSRRLRGELIVYQSSRRPSVSECVRGCVCVFTLSNMNISETNGSIATKFYLKHRWVRGLAA